MVPYANCGTQNASARSTTHKICAVANWDTSEEAQEARNKHFRQYREMHSRRFSRIAANQDVMTMLCITSDPLISLYRQTQAQHKEAATGNMEELLY